MSIPIALFGRKQLLVILILQDAGGSIEHAKKQAEFYGETAHQLLVGNEQCRITKINILLFPSKILKKIFK